VALNRLAIVLGAVFGLIYVVANARMLPSPYEPLLHVLGVIAFVAVVVALRRASPKQAESIGTGRNFGRGYWLVVVAEVVAGVAGVVLLNGPIDLPHGVLPWVSFVVGAHFFGLAKVWGESSLGWLGAGIAVLGAFGLGLASAGASDATIAFVAGVCPGGLLLTGSLWGAARRGRL
jgi:hypothetical protein